MGGIGCFSPFFFPLPFFFFARSSQDLCAIRGRPQDPADEGPFLRVGALQREHLQVAGVAWADAGHDEVDRVVRPPTKEQAAAAQAEPEPAAERERGEERSCGHRFLIFGTRRKYRQSLRMRG